MKDTFRLLKVLWMLGKRGGCAEGSHICLRLPFPPQCQQQGPWAPLEEGLRVLLIVRCSQYHAPPCMGIAHRDTSDGLLWPTVLPPSSRAMVEVCSTCTMRPYSPSLTGEDWRELHPAVLAVQGRGRTSGTAFRRCFPLARTSGHPFRVTCSSAAWGTICSQHAALQAECSPQVVPTGAEPAPTLAVLQPGTGRHLSENTEGLVACLHLFLMLKRWWPLLCRLGCCFLGVSSRLHAQPHSSLLVLPAGASDTAPEHGASPLPSGLPPGSFCIESAVGTASLLTDLLQTVCFQLNKIFQVCVQLNGFWDGFVYGRGSQVRSPLQHPEQCGVVRLTAFQCLQDEGSCCSAMAHQHPHRHYSETDGTALHLSHKDCSQIH